MGTESALHTTTSASILEGLRDTGNETVWRTYVDRYRPVVVRFVQSMGVSREDAEDVAQETLLGFLNAYREGRYDRKRGRLRAWLYGIAQIQVRSWRRRQRRHESQRAGQGEESDAVEEIQDREDPEADWEREWRQGILEACFAEVRRETTPRAFRAFELFALKEWPAQQVADELGMTPNAVYLVKSRILQRVRELMPMMEEIW